jgi:phage anti-repressor protein
MKPIIKLKMCERDEKTYELDHKFMTLRKPPKTANSYQQVICCLLLEKN